MNPCDLLTGYVIQNYKTGDFIGHQNGGNRGALCLSKTRPKIYSSLKHVSKAIELITHYNNLVVRKINMEVTNV